MRLFYGDFHIHVGRSQGRPVKMAAAASLTLDALVAHAQNQKGLHLVTVIDGVCPPVLAEVQERVRDGRWAAVSGGGYAVPPDPQHPDRPPLVVVLGAEVEVSGPRGGAAHFGCWFGEVEAAADFAAWLATVQTNP
ncbi:MAG: endonuclease Q family protein, partial [Alicyclobacillus sp.]|nr:endonuclease Q family protein [Alicyclobacillus sp.]